MNRFREDVPYKVVRVLGATALARQEARLMGMETLQRRLLLRGIQLDVLANVYDDLAFNWSVAIRTVHHEGFKGLFWREHVTPRAVRSYDYVWLFDADVRVADFRLWRVLAMMSAHGALIAQPRIEGTRRGAHPYKTTDHPHLRVQARCASCEAQCTDFVEVMTPIFARRAWRHVYRHMLARVPTSVLRESIDQIDTRWCAAVARAFPNGIPCVVSNETLVHTNHRTLDRRRMRRSNTIRVLANRGLRDGFEDTWCPLCLTPMRNSCAVYARAGYTAPQPLLVVKKNLQREQARRWGRRRVSPSWHFWSS